MNFVNYPVITAPDPMKIIVPTHLGCCRVWQVATNLLNLTLYLDQISFRNVLDIFPNRWAIFYNIRHLSKPQMFPEFLGRNVIPKLFKRFSGIFNVNDILNFLKQLQLFNRDQCRNFLASSRQNN